MIIKNIIIQFIPWKIINKLFYNHFLLNFKKKIDKKNKIKNILIHITENCNLNCIYCYEKNNKRKEKTLNHNDIFSIIKQAKKLKVKSIQFLGGEPFLYPKFKELLKYTIKKGFHVNIYTNGFVINDNWIEFLKKYKENIYLNIKFDSKNGYIKHLGKDLFDKIIQNIKFFKKNNLKIKTYITVTKNNINDIEKLIKTSYEMNSYPIIERFIPICNNKINKKLEITDKEWVKVLQIFNKNNKYADFYKFISNKKGYYCNCYNSVISFDIYGNASPCAYIQNLNFANIFDENLKKIFEKFEKYQQSWNKIPKECSDCKNKITCRGGCKTYRFIKYNSLDKKDPFCTKEKIVPNITVCNHNCNLIE